MPKFRDLTGMKFGKWTVKYRAESEKDKRGYPITMWHCLCECGTERDVYANALLQGKSKSCGCDKSSVQDWCKTNFSTHGHSKTRLYKIWAGIKKRCLNPNSSNYKNYGARGISVCDEWLQFEPFEVWALSNGYDDSLSIDRIDVNGSYSPENCHWATRAEQANNKRNNKYYEFDGQNHTISEWSSICGIPYERMYKWLRRGLTFEEIFIKQQQLTA